MTRRHTHGGNRHALSCDHAYTVDDAMHSNGVLEYPICYDVTSFANPLRHYHMPLWTTILKLTL